MHCFLNFENCRSEKLKNLYFWQLPRLSINKIYETIKDCSRLWSKNSAQKKSVIDENHNKFMNATQGYEPKTITWKSDLRLICFTLKLPSKTWTSPFWNDSKARRTSLHHQILPNNHAVVHIFLMVLLQGHFEVKSSKLLKWIIRVRTARSFHAKGDWRSEGL